MKLNRNILEQLVEETLSEMAIKIVKFYINYIKQVKLTKMVYIINMKNLLKKEKLMKEKCQKLCIILGQ